MKNIFRAAILSSVFLFSSCNQFAKHFGGSITVELEKDQTLVNCSWKRESLWILVRARESGEVPKTYKYTEKSAYGIIEGTVTIIEK